ncbi:MAG: TonB-dependent receptor plug domain-containing protein, partial [Chitinophagaceae bacterium]|nr:TonB-dependent receptor plug domain-containing protein [Chitinophagaceae bacterium]
MTRKSTFIQQTKKRICLKKGMDLPKSLFLFLVASGIQTQAMAFAETTDWRLKLAASEKITGRLNSTAFQQNTIRGKVVDGNGNALSGVSVTLKGKNTAAVTNDDGVFEIQAQVGETLVFSSVGHVSKEITINSLSPVNVVLAIANEQLSEVVVVGYGKQKKANLTGAVDQVGSEVFENRPMPNVTQGLQGAIPNLNINLADGKPTRSASYEIRGMGSIGQGGSALILIDGVEGDPAMLNPDDIESVSVLKDAASAAIYGARGSFGVVLITTKDPKKGKTSVNYTGNLISKSATVLPDMVTDGYLYTKMFLEAYSSYYDYSRLPTAFHRSYTFKQDWYDEMANRRPGSGKPEVEVDANGNYLYYANTDWYNILFKNQAWGNEHNLSVQGATDKNGFIISGRYYTQDGLYRYNSDDYSMYNLRAKGFAKIFDWLVVDNNTELSQMNYFYPHRVGDGSVWYGLEGDSNPMIPMFNPDGTLTMGAAFSAGDLWYGKNGITTKKRLLRNTTSFTSSFFNDVFRVKGDLTFRNADGLEQVRRVPVPYSNKVGQISYIGTETNDL